jgi:hypothetical protein
VWDLAGGRAPLSPFWLAARELDPNVEDESGLAGGREGHLRALFEQADLRDVKEAELPASLSYETFDEWWEPYTLGVGPAGGYTKKLDPERLTALRERARQLLATAPFRLNAVAWATRGVVP